MSHIQVPPVRPLVLDDLPSEHLPREGLPHEDLARAGDALASALTVDDVVGVLRRCARRVAGSDGIAVVLREGGCCRYVAEDAIEPLWTGGRFPLETCVSGWAMLHDETVVVPDIESDPRVPFPLYANKAIRSLAMVPVGSPAPVAALGAYWCAMIWPDAAAIARLETLARHAGDALARIDGTATARTDSA